jgi:hypothetical protein
MLRLQQSCRRGLATLHVAMQIGLYHHRLRDARRVVSEGIRCRIFPADCPQRTDCHSITRVLAHSRIFQHIARFVAELQNRSFLMGRLRSI